MSCYSRRQKDDNKANLEAQVLALEAEAQALAESLQAAGTKIISLSPPSSPRLKAQSKVLPVCHALLHSASA